MREFVMSIGGAAAVAQEKRGVVDPAAREVFAQAPVCSREQLDQAMAAAQAAAGWGQDDGARVAALQAAADAVAATRDDLAVVLSREQGKPLQAAQFEVAETTLEPHLPFGGVKWSGAGVENGPWGLEEFSSLRVLYQSRR